MARSNSAAVKLISSIVEASRPDLQKLAFLQKKCNEFVGRSQLASAVSDAMLMTQKLHSRAMRLLARLEYEPESCASWYVIFRQSPKRHREHRSF
jgi:hypothetical protein